MTVENSIDNQLASADAFGVYRRMHGDLLTTATTAATVDCGYVSALRWARPLVLPSSFGPGITGIYFTRIDMLNEDGNVSLMCGLEYLMGTLTVSGNSFSSGVAMPTKNVFGSSIVTASEMAFAVIRTTLTATTPVLTTTYTDQDGNTGATCTMTLPTNAAARSAFFVNPHLASGDTGIRSITNMSISTGSAGVIDIYGVLVLQVTLQASVTLITKFNPGSIALNQWKGEAGESLGFYRFGSATSCQLIAAVAGVGDY